GVVRSSPFILDLAARDVDHELGGWAGSRGVWGVSWPQPRMCKFAGLQIERFYNVGRQRIKGSCPLVWGHCLQDKLLGFRRVRFRNNIGNMHRLAAKSKRGHPNNLSRDWLQFSHARQYARWPSPRLVP